MAAFRPEIWINAFVSYFGELPSLLDAISRYDEFVGTGTFGDTIKVPGLTLPAAIDIVPGAVGAGALQAPVDVTVGIVLDKMKGHPIPVTPQDERFNHPDYINAIMRDAGRTVKDASNTSVLALAADAAVTQEVNADGSALGDADLLEVKRLMDEARCPELGRIMALTPKGANDLASISTFTNSQFGAGQNQNQLQMCRGMEVKQFPTTFFAAAGGNSKCLAFHPMMIGGAVARPWLELQGQAGEFRKILEIAAIYGLKIRKATGLVRILRAT